MTKTQPDAPGSERGYRPCVGIMVLNNAGLVWIGKRSDAPGDAEGRGAWWQMPQGGIDDGEDPERAALRELYEETGMRSVEVVASIPAWLTYDLPPELQGIAWGGRYRGQKQRWFLVRFTGTDDEISIAPGPGHKREFDSWRWAPAGELVELIVPFKRPVYTAVIADFGRLARPTET
jgi:putative (di)nucleoside polyphosphate hydrolase